MGLVESKTKVKLHILSVLSRQYVYWANKRMENPEQIQTISIRVYWTTQKENFTFFIFKR